MQRLILIAAVFISIVSCQKLSGENDYQLADNCKEFKNEVEQKIIKVNVDKGIHYVEIDTTNCLLKIRYEADKADLSWLYQRLDTLGYLAAVEDSSTAPVDSLTTDTLIIDKEVNEYTQPKEEASHWSDSPSE